MPLYTPHASSPSLPVPPRPRSLLSACIGANAAGDPRLNILFIFADDWGRYASCYRGLDGKETANDLIETPNIDRVAHEGALFRNAFVNSPNCTPCRSSLVSGRYFFQTGRGAILSGAIWDPSIPSFPLLLRDAGYQIGKSFKVWSPGTPRDAPFGEQSYAYQASGERFNKFSLEATKLMGAGYTLAAAHATLLAEVRGNFDTFLADCEPGNPWHYWFGPKNTHRPWKQGSGKAMWGINPDTLQGLMPAFLPDVPEVREDFADYLGEALALDAFVGVLIDRLEEVGELEHTVIVISGDHSIPGVTNGKCNLYDLGTAVPLIVRYPGAIPGRIVDDYVSLPDLMPTFLQIGGVPIPDGVVGRSILPQLRASASGMIDPGRNWVIAGRERHGGDAREGGLPYPMRSLRTPDFLYIRNFAPDRWPTGAPDEAAKPRPDLDLIGRNTHVAYTDMDASPTKRWLVEHQHDADWGRFATIAFGKRPAEEIYDLHTIPTKSTTWPPIRPTPRPRPRSPPSSWPPSARPAIRGWPTACPSSTFRPSPTTPRGNDRRTPSYTVHSSIASRSEVSGSCRGRNSWPTKPS